MKRFSFPAASLGSYLICHCNLRALPGGLEIAELLVADEKWFNGNIAVSPVGSKPHPCDALGREQTDIQTEPFSLLRDVSFRLWTHEVSVVQQDGSILLWEGRKTSRFPLFEETSMWHVKSVLNMHLRGEEHAENRKEISCNKHY